MSYQNLYGGYPPVVHPYATQGVFGNLLSQLAPVAGQAIGGAFGQGQLGGALGQIAGQAAGAVPFAAGPQAYLAPQGVFGNLLSQLAPVAGQAIGGAFGQGQLGSALGQIAGQAAGAVPFAAGPQSYVAPQGIDIGAIMNTVGQIAQQAAPLLPLLLMAAGPQARPATA